MNDEHDHTIELLDADLVTLLSQVFALGFVDAMAGRPVTDDDLISPVDAGPIQHLALGYIAQGEGMIHSVFDENPQLVFDSLYRAGQVAYSELERQYVQRN